MIDIDAARDAADGPASSDERAADWLAPTDVSAFLRYSTRRHRREMPGGVPTARRNAAPLGRTPGAYSQGASPSAVWSARCAGPPVDYYCVTT